MNNMFQRSIPLLGIEGITKLNDSHVAIFGLGGVGGNTVEALARAGVGNFSLFDFDIVNESNKNRQIIALDSTIGKAKVNAMKDRILDINPNIVVNIYNVKVDEEFLNTINFTEFDYVADCIDDVKGKLAIIKKSKENNVKIISSCGTGNKLDPTKFMIKDINQTSVCPLAKKIRLELRRFEIKGVDVLSIDSSGVSLKGLEKAIAVNQIHNVKIVNKNLFKYPLDKDELKGLEALVIDPPRAGAHEQCRQIAQMDNKDKPKKIVFVSCNPSTFVYDANTLIQGNYKLEKITLVDQFVYSNHMELIALFTLNQEN